MAKPKISSATLCGQRGGSGKYYHVGLAGYNFANAKYMTVSSTTHNWSPPLAIVQEVKDPDGNVYLRAKFEVTKNNPDIDGVETGDVTITVTGMNAGDVSTPPFAATAVYFDNP